MVCFCWRFQAGCYGCNQSSNMDSSTGLFRKLWHQTHIKIAKPTCKSLLVYPLTVVCNMFAWCKPFTSGIYHVDSPSLQAAFCRVIKWFLGVWKQRPIKWNWPTIPLSIMYMSHSLPTGWTGLNFMVKVWKWWVPHAERPGSCTHGPNCWCEYKWCC